MVTSVLKQHTASNYKDIYMNIYCYENLKISSQYAVEEKHLTERN
jgi:hypothetical protein